MTTDSKLADDPGPEIDPYEKCTINCSYQDGIMKKLTVNTTCMHKVPDVYHEPFVIRGYRKIGRPWLYYVKSIFQLHNESVNVWSHLLAALLIFKKIRDYSYHLDFVNDPYTWPLLNGMIAIILMFILSAFAHCFQSKSEIAHYVVFMFDYMGVSFYSLYSAFMFLEYTSDNELYNATTLILYYISLFLSCGVSLGCIVSKTMFSKPYPFSRTVWQILPIAIMYVIILTPLLQKIYYCYYHQDCIQSLELHSQHMFWFILSAFFFTNNFPECCAPVGVCDHFAVSHQLFHICIMITSCVQLDAVLADFKLFEKQIRDRPQPTFLYSSGPIFFLWFFDMLCILGFYLYMKQKMSKESLRVIK